MSAKVGFLLLLSLFVNGVLSKERFFPERYRNAHYSECSSKMLNVRNLQSEQDNEDKKDNTSSSSVPLITTIRLYGGSELGYYYTNLFFGSPVQKQTLIVDTGSVTTAIPCIECKENCGTRHFDKPFDHTVSSTFQEFDCMESFGNYECSDCTTKCRFHVGYVEGSSYTGHFKKDYVAFGNEIEDYIVFNANKAKGIEGSLNITKEDFDNIVQKQRLFMPFGCTEQETKLFFTQEADGILGLGINTNTYSTPPNLLDTLKLNNPLADISFSLCLAPTGGYFSIGGHNEEFHHEDSEITYTSFDDTSSQYKVRVNRIMMEGKKLDISKELLNRGDGAFFDSGTTLTHVPSETYNIIKDKVGAFCEKEGNCGGKGAASANYNLCWKWDSSKYPTVDDFFKTFPSFTFYFGDDGKGEYSWRAEDYLYLKQTNDNNFCMGLSKYERETILGGTFMKNHDVLFDKTNKRIGFARANCSAVSAPAYLPQDESSFIGAGNIDTTKAKDIPNNVGKKTKDNTSNSTDDSGSVKSQAYKILIALAVLCGFCVIVSIICLAVRSIRKARYAAMANEAEEPSHPTKDFKYSPDKKKVNKTEGSNSDRSEEGTNNASQYQV